MLCYITVVFGLLGGSLYSPIGFLFLAGIGGGAFGIANEKKWGYLLAVAAAVFQVAFPLAFFTREVFRYPFILSFMFDIALVALLLHKQSREYQRIWFK